MSHPNVTCTCHVEFESSTSSSRTQLSPAAWPQKLSTAADFDGFVEFARSIWLFEFVLFTHSSYHTAPSPAVWRTRLWNALHLDDSLSSSWHLYDLLSSWVRVIYSFITLHSAITGGMAYEAMNCAGYLKQRMIVILNDNGQVSFSLLYLYTYIQIPVHICI